ncbi:hypothetical protein C8A03DRAFT_33919 [Achaetomium macrosporum]|uniref:AAA+ ATPase domain-containing protein n=1 Tax=Achaetomium macrosporum TaxID=79813 RepID=A0AAN7HDW6_9PEZI|nr:hypothetical protein C8A03DRAFT_33919 [Achaetomium macrosporum]
MAAVVNIEVRAKGNAPASDADWWEAEIWVDGTCTKTGVRISSTTTADEEEGLREYLERYAQRYPYSSVDAKVAIIERYARALWDQLGMEAELPREQDGVRVTTLALTILEMPTPGGASRTSRTVHQLHWELLEGLQVRGPDGPRLLVKRSMPVRDAKPTGGLADTIKSVSLVGTDSDTINILLVVARNLTANAAIYNDISPWTAFDILKRVRRTLARRGAPVRVNVEVVRPGGFEALKEHLARRERGYYQIVHFDLHGVVRKEGGGFQSYLRFNRDDKDTLKLVNVPALKVALQLKKHNVCCAVLNACESARANAGDGANIAAVFRSRGVKTVLAMSYKISARAADIFLQTFYTSFLTEGLSFAVAARAGRDALRQSPSHGARFRLERDVLDWFVPVLYSSNEEFAVRSDRVFIPPVASADISTPKANRPLEPSSDLRLFGRDFDVLRLERILLSQKTVFLHGPSGSGKTSLLNYAVELWNETSFVDAVVRVDFAEHQDVSTEDKFTQLVEQKLLACPGIAKRHKPTGALNQGPIWARIEHLLKAQSTILIFDHLDAVLTVLGTHRLDLESDSSPRPNLLSACGKLLSLVSTTPTPNVQSSHHPVYTILTDKRSRILPALTTTLSLAFTPTTNIYPLAGIELAHAIDLATHILLQSSGAGDTTTTTTTTAAAWPNNTDLDHHHQKLQLVVQALQCLPGVMQLALPQARRSGVPWAELYTTLVCNTQRVFQSPSPSLDDPPPGGVVTCPCPCPVWDVLAHARLTQPPAVFRGLMLLGAYWYEAPGEEVFLAAAAGPGPPGEEEGLLLRLVGCDRASFRTAVVAAVEFGLVSEGPTGAEVSLWVHPAFTLWCRCWALWDGAVSREVRAFFHGLAGYEAEVDDTWFVRVLCEPDAAVIGRGGREKEFVTRFMGALEAAYMLSMAAKAVAGSDYEYMTVVYPTRLPNLLAFIRICLAAGDSLAIDDWPTQFLSLSTAHIRMTGMLPEMTLFGEQYGLLLSEIIRRQKPRHSKAFPVEMLGFVLFIANYLASTYLSDVRLPKDPTPEFAKVALDIGDASEPEGGYQSSFLIYMRGFAYRYNLMLAMRNATKDKLEESISTIEHFWDLSDQNDEKYLRQLEVEGSEPVQNPLLDALPEDLLTFDPRALKDVAPKAFVKLRKQLSGLRAPLLQQMRTGDVEGAKGKMEAVFGDLTTGLRGVYSALAESGFSHLESQTQWSLKDQDFVRFSQMMDTEDYRLSELDLAVDSGDVMTAAHQHLALMLGALKKEKVGIDEAARHVDAIEALYEGDPQYAEQLKDHMTKAEVLKSNGRMLATLDSMPEDLPPSQSTPAIQAVLEQNDKMVEAMKALNLPFSDDAARIIQIGGENWQKAMEQNPALAAASSKDLAARIKQSQEDAIQYVLTNVRDMDSFQNLVNVGLEMQTLTQQRAKAVEEKNLDGELRILDRQLELAKSEVGALFRHFGYDVQELTIDRAAAELKRRWRVMMVELNFTGTRNCLEHTSELVPPDLLGELWATTEEIQLVVEMMSAGPGPAGRRVYDTLLEMHDRGQFSHMNQTKLAEEIKKIRHWRSWLLALDAYWAKRWTEALRRVDECLANAGADLQENPEHYAEMVGMKRGIEMFRR